MALLDNSLIFLSSSVLFLLESSSRRPHVFAAHEKRRIQERSKPGVKVKTRPYYFARNNVGLQSLVAASPVVDDAATAGAQSSLPLATVHTTVTRTLERGGARVLDDGSVTLRL
eukprot:gene10271-7293_t